MILLEWSDHAAVVARMVVLDHKLLPLLGGEETCGALTQRAVLLALRSEVSGCARWYAAIWALSRSVWRA